MRVRRLGLGISEVLPRTPSLEITVARTILGVLIVILAPFDASAQTGSDSDSAVVDPVAREVSAILVDQCVSCHGPMQKKGGLDLSRRATAVKGGKSGTAIVPGSADLSLLVDKVAEGEMPPKEALRREQVAAVRAWVEAGAIYASEPLSPRRAGADWWSLRPICRDCCRPNGTGAIDWALTPIDAFIPTGPALAAWPRPPRPTRRP